MYLEFVCGWAGDKEDSDWCRSEVCYTVGWCDYVLVSSHYSDISISFSIYLLIVSTIFVWNCSCPYHQVLGFKSVFFFKYPHRVIVQLYQQITIALTEGYGLWIASEFTVKEQIVDLYFWCERLVKLINQHKSRLFCS